MRFKKTTIALGLATLLFIESHACEAVKDVPETSTEIAQVLEENPDVQRITEIRDSVMQMRYTRQHELNKTGLGMASTGPAYSRSYAGRMIQYDTIFRELYPDITREHDSLTALPHVIRATKELDGLQTKIFLGYVALIAYATVGYGWYTKKNDATPSTAHLDR